MSSASQLLGLLVLALRAASAKLQPAPYAVVAAGIFVIQALIGAANIWTELADEVSAAHLAGATLLWLALAMLNIRVHRLYELLPLSSSPSHGRADLAGATR